MQSTIHEQNAIPGLTNKILYRFANKVFEGFPGTFKQKHVLYSGSPIRKEIWLVNKKFQENLENPFRILVIGGSSGAKFFNNFLPKVMHRICSEKEITVLHQTGRSDFAVTQELYRALNLEDRVKVVPYVEAMDEAYRTHDLLLSRAGASTISEILAVGINSILIPFPHSVDSHQDLNARFLADKGACHTILEKDCTLDAVVSLVRKVGFNDEVRRRVISNISSIAIPNSAPIIVNSCMELFNA